MKAKRLLFPTLLIAALSLGVFIGALAPNGDFFALRKNFQIFSSIYEELVVGYVDELDPERLMRSGIEAMLEDLDPYTTFIDEGETADIDIITRGRYAGVGLNIGIRNGKITVISPVEGTSGYRQGVRTGDVIINIAGRSAEDLDPSDLRSLLRGEPGTAVEITVRREGESEPLHFLLTREEVQLKNVSYSGFVDDDTAAGIGYVKLERFARDAGTEMRRHVQQLQATGRLKGLIVDLRDNPGGLLDAAVEVTQLFVPQGSEIVSTRGRLPQTERVYHGKSAPLVPDLPLAVLIDEYSASASEIVAGALQDLDRAVIVGHRSFGKGLVQIIKPLPYNTSLKMTTSKYYTPSGRSIQSVDYGEHDGTFSEIPDSLRRTFRTAAGRPVRDGGGIEPDIPVKEGEASELEEALDRRAAFFFFANHYAAEHPSVPADFAVTDETLRAFRAWLNDQSFTYNTEAERAAEELGTHLAETGYTRAADEAEALKRAVEQEKAADFERYKERIRERLRTEILARYYGESAQIRTSLAHDEDVRHAIEVLKDQSAYAAMLSTSRR